MEKLCYKVFCIFLYKKRSFPSYAKRLFRNEAKYDVIDTKIIFYCHANKTHFERKVLHLASFWKLEFSELVKGLSIDTCKHSQRKLSSLLSSDKKLSNLRLSNIITLLTASFPTEFWFIFLNVTNYIIHVEYWKKKWEFSIRSFSAVKSETSLWSLHVSASVAICYIPWSQRYPTAREEGEERERFLPASDAFSMTHALAFP